MIMRRKQRENNLTEAHIEFGRFYTLHEYKYSDFNAFRNTSAFTHNKCG